MKPRSSTSSVKSDGGDPVDPRPVAIPLDDDPIVVPAVVPEGVLRLGLDLIEPLAPSALVVEPPRRPGLLAGDLALRSVVAIEIEVGMPR